MYVYSYILARDRSRPNYDGGSCTGNNCTRNNCTRNNCNKNKCQCKNCKRSLKKLYDDH